jgi:hypothetical protein
MANAFGWWPCLFVIHNNDIHALSQQDSPSQAKKAIF